MGILSLLFSCRKIEVFYQSLLSPLQRRKASYSACAKSGCWEQKCQLQPKRGLDPLHCDSASLTLQEREEQQTLTSRSWSDTYSQSSVLLEAGLVLTAGHAILLLDINNLTEHKHQARALSARDKMRKLEPTS